MKSLIYGYGITGKSFERYLKKKKIAYDIFDHNIPEYSIKLDLNNYKNILCRLEIASFLKTRPGLIVLMGGGVFSIART